MTEMMTMKDFEAEMSRPDYILFSKIATGKGPMLTFDEAFKGLTGDRAMFATVKDATDAEKEQMGSEEGYTIRIESGEPGALKALPSLWWYDGAFAVPIEVPVGVVKALRLFAYQQSGAIHNEIADTEHRMEMLAGLKARHWDLLDNQQKGLLHIQGVKPPPLAPKVEKPVLAAVPDPEPGGK